MADAAAPGSNTIGVESGLHYIQTQHRGECVYDSFQMILTFADGLRALNAEKAQQLFRSDPVGLLTNSESYKMAVGMFMFSMGEKEFKAFLEKNQDKNYKRLVFFYSLVLRRYILIKLQECGWDTEALETKYGLGSGGIQTLCPGVIDFGRETRLQRQKSLNVEGSSYAAIHLMEATGIEPNYSSGTLKTKGATIPHINAITNALFTLPVLADKFEASMQFAGMKRLVGIAITAHTADGRSGHENSIVKYRGEYYYCDNEIGVAKKIELGDIDSMRSDSVSYGYDDRGYFFSVNGDVLFLDPARRSDPMLFNSSHLVYIYANSEPVFGEKDTCSLKPPAKAATDAAGSKSSVRFIQETAVSGIRNLVFGAAVGRNAEIPMLKGTRRAGKAFLPHFGLHGKSKKTRRNARK